MQLKLILKAKALKDSVQLMAPNKALSNIPVLKKAFASRRDKTVHTSSQEMIIEDRPSNVSVLLKVFMWFISRFHFKLQWHCLIMPRLHSATLKFLNIKLLTLFI